MFVQYRLIPPRGDKAGAYLGLHVRRGGIERALGLIAELFGRGLLRVGLPSVTIGSQSQGLVDEPTSRLARRTFIEDWALSVKDRLLVSGVFEVEFASHVQSLSCRREIVRRTRMFAQLRPHVKSRTAHRALTSAACPPSAFIPEPASTTFVSLYRLDCLTDKSMRLHSHCGQSRMPKRGRLRGFSVQCNVHG